MPKKVFKWKALNGVAVTLWMWLQLIQQRKWKMSIDKYTAIKGMHICRVDEQRIGDFLLKILHAYYLKAKN